MQLCKAVYLQAEVTAFSRLAHMLLLRKCEEKHWSDQNLAEDQLCEGGWMWHPAHQHTPHTLQLCGGQGHRKLGGEVLFWWTRHSLVLQRSLRLRVENQQENKARKQEETREVFPLLVTLLKAVSTKAPWAVRKLQGDKARSGVGPLLHNSSLAAHAAGINSSTGPACLQHNPGLALTLTLKRQHEVFQD